MFSKIQLYIYVVPQESLAIGEVETSYLPFVTCSGKAVNIKRVLISSISDIKNITQLF